MIALQLHASIDVHVLDYDIVAIAMLNNDDSYGFPKCVSYSTGYDNKHVILTTAAFSLALLFFSTTLCLFIVTVRMHKKMKRGLQNFMLVIIFYYS